MNEFLAEIVFRSIRRLKVQRHGYSSRRNALAEVVETVSSRAETPYPAPTIREVALVRSRTTVPANATFSPLARSLAVTVSVIPL